MLCSLFYLCISSPRGCLGGGGFCICSFSAENNVKCFSSSFGDVLQLSPVVLASDGTGDGASNRSFSIS